MHRSRTSTLCIATLLGACQKDHVISLNSVCYQFGEEEKNPTHAYYADGLVRKYTLIYTTNRAFLHTCLSANQF